jgi:hypothetical protein
LRNLMIAREFDLIHNQADFVPPGEQEQSL